MELTTKIIIGAAALGGAAILLWPSKAGASGLPPAGTSIPHGGQSIGVKPGQVFDLSQVKDVQKGLVTCGVSVGPDGVDGWFGKNTAAAVRKFSTSNGGADSGQITNAFRALLATCLKAKGFNVTVATGPTLDRTTGPTHGGALVTGVVDGVGAIVSGVGSFVGRAFSSHAYAGGPILQVGPKHDRPSDRPSRGSFFDRRSRQ